LLLGDSLEELFVSTPLALVPFAQVSVLPLPLVGLVARRRHCDVR